jgi:iron complex transport system permease protein
VTGARVSYGGVLGGLSVGVVVVAVLSLLVGPAAIGFFDILKGLFGDGSSTVVLIATEVRLPRTLMGLLVGATLGLSGAALQGYLRNPLAEPGLIGVSAGAALGAVLALYYGLSALIAWAVPIGGMVGAGIAVLLVQLLAGRGSTTLTLILAGIAVSSFAGALTSLALNLAPSPYAIVEIVFWMLGSITDRSLEHVALSAPFMLIGWVILLSLGRALDAMALGEEAAQSLGFDPLSVRRRVIAGTALAVGAAVSVSGIIGFVGLVVPHILRPFVDHRPGRLLVASALGGALLTLLADILVRIITPSGELKLGVVTAIVGAPIFLHLVLRMRRAEA